MWYKMKGEQESVFKYHKTSLGILILLYVFSAARCSLDFKHANGHVEKDIIPDIHCGTGVNSIIPLESVGPALIDLPSYRKLCPFIIEPKLPILVYSIFKIPKPS